MEGAHAIQKEERLRENKEGVVLEGGIGAKEELQKKKVDPL